MMKQSIREPEKPYNTQTKKITAIRLKELRQSLRDEKGRRFSHEMLANKLNEKYGVGAISDKTLLNYEITDESHEKFTVGLGMKIDNLVMLADFYNVSCDYLLGREGNQDNLIGQARMEMGLSAKAAEVLFQLKAMGSQIAGRPDVLDTINKMFETINMMIETTGYIEHEINKDSSYTLKATGYYYKDGLMNCINDFLRFTCEPQDITTYNKLKGKTIKTPYILDEEVLSNLLLLEINKELMSLRNNIQKNNDNLGDKSNV